MSYLNELWSRPDRLVTQSNNSLIKDIDATHNYKNIKAVMYEPPYMQEPNNCKIASLPHDPEESISI